MEAGGGRLLLESNYRTAKVTERSSQADRCAGGFILTLDVGITGCAQGNV